MEAHHWRYHPLVSALELELPTIGPLRDIEMCFSGPIAAGDIRLNPALGAGVLLDFGCYLIQWQKLLTGDPKPQVLEAKAVLGSPGVEVAVDLELKSCAGAHIKMALDMRPHTTFRACLSVEGEAGRLHYENPLAIDGSFLRISRGGAEQRIPGAGPSTYRGQLEQLVSSLYSGAAPPTSGADLVETQEMLDALVLACGLPARDELARQAQAAVT
jgi:predicted dehydrogenase